MDHRTAYFWGNLSKACAEARDAIERGGDVPAKWGDEPEDAYVEQVMRATASCAEAPPTDVSVVASRLISAAGNLQSAVNALEHLGERLYGPIPECDAADMSQGGGCGALGEVHFLFDRLDTLIARAGSAAKRIQNLA